MSTMVQLLAMGFHIERVVSKMKGFEVYSLVHPVTGERVLYWKRIGRITPKSVERLRSIVRVPADRLVVEFEGRVDVDPEADRLLREMFGRVEYVGGAETRYRLPAEIRVGDGIRVLLRRKTRGSIRIAEPEDLDILMSTGNEWLLVVRRNEDGTVDIIADNPPMLDKYLSEARAKRNMAVFIVKRHRRTVNLHLVPYYALEEGEE